MLSSTYRAGVVEDAVMSVVSVVECGTNKGKASSGTGKWLSLLPTTMRTSPY